MFQSAIHLRYEVREGRFHEYYFHILDPDFGGENWSYTIPKSRASDGSTTLYTVETGAIIKCYEDKKLDVAHNLALHHRWMAKKGYCLEYEIERAVEQIPEYKQYADKVNNYLRRYDNLKAFL